LNFRFCSSSCSFSLLTIFIVFFGVRESPSSICLAQPFDCAQGKQNEPKEKALSRQVFFKEILKKISLKTIF